MTRALITTLMLIGGVAVSAHPGHDPIAVIGTLTRVSPERIDVETYDTTVMQKRTITIVTDQATKWRLGKKPINRGELPVGTPVVVSFSHAELKDGRDGLVALEIRGREAKKK